MLSDKRVRIDIQNFECSHMGKEVTIKSQFVYPIGILRGTLPRILSRKCDHYADCHLQDKSACHMAVDRIH